MGQEVEALQFNMGDVVLVYLTTPDTEVKNTLAVYEAQSGNIYQFAKVEMGNGYYIILNPPADAEVSEQYAASMVEIGEYGAVQAYGNQEPSLSDFYLVYAINNTGNIGWYQYDKSEGTLQRYTQQSEGTSVDEEALNADMKSMQNSYDKLNEQYTSEKSFARKTIAVLIFIIAVLVVIIVNLFLRRGKDEDEWEDDFKEVPKRFRKKADEPEALEEELTEEPEEEKPKRGLWKKKSQKEVDWEEKEVEKKPEKKPERKPEKKAPEKEVEEKGRF